MMDGMGWGGWFVGSLMMIAFWALVIWAVLTFVRGPVARRPGDDPEEVLARRFAAGEIDEAEYHERLETLRGTRAARASQSPPH
jgi:putative membrane protein